MDACQPSLLRTDMTVGLDSLRLMGDEPLLVDDKYTTHVCRYPKPPCCVVYHVVSPVAGVASRRVGHYIVLHLPRHGVYAVDAVVGGHPDVAVAVFVNLAHSVVRQWVCAAGLLIPHHLVVAPWRGPIDDDAVGATHPYAPVGTLQYGVQTVAVALTGDVVDVVGGIERLSHIDRQSVVGTRKQVVVVVGEECPHDVVGQRLRVARVVYAVLRPPVAVQHVESVVGTYK